jgi:hypothetical protein
MTPLPITDDAPGGVQIRVVIQPHRHLNTPRKILREMSNKMSVTLAKRWHGLLHLCGDVFAD